MYNYYKKKPIIIEAAQWTGPECQIEGVFEEILQDKKLYYVITIHGQRAYLDLNDWIIKEPNGVNHYPCKPDIFEERYEYNY